MWLCLHWASFTKHPNLQVFSVIFLVSHSWHNWLDLTWTWPGPDFDNYQICMEWFADVKISLYRHNHHAVDTPCQGNLKSYIMTKTSVKGYFALILVNHDKIYITGYFFNEWQGTWIKVKDFYFLAGRDILLQP